MPINVGLVKTAHGGLHVYCNLGNYKLPSNRCVKAIKTDNFDVDIFA
jgi:nickel-dependent lactate racemase